MGIGKKTSTATAVALAVLALTSCASSNGGPTTAEQQVQALPATFTKQHLNWQQCPASAKGINEIRCALLTVPVDYNSPTGRTMKVAVDEIPAAGKDEGVIFTNPGGPGGEGITLPIGVAVADPKLHEHFDFVGMNPRGFGAYKGLGAGATKLTCTDQQVKVTPIKFPEWTTEALRAQASASQEQEAQCEATSDGLRQYVTTPNTARDMDLLRTVLGQQKIDYYGVSYGTYLGATYGTMFPDDLNRMVLDGSMSPLTTWYEQSVPDNETALFNFNQFADWAVKNKQGLGDSPAAVREEVNNLYKDLQTNSEGGYEHAEFANAVGVFSRNRPGWKQFATSIRNALNQVRGKKPNPAVSQDVAEAEAQTQPDTKEADEGLSVGVYSAVTCDWPWPKADDAGYRVYQDNMNYWDKTFPYGGTVSAVGPSACTFSKTEADLPKITSRAGYPQGLVVNADGDTQTPLSTAQEMAKTLDFDLITVTDDGTHGLSFHGNTCVDNAVTNYFLTGKLPGDITCPTAAGPNDTESLTQAEDHLSQTTPLPRQHHASALPAAAVPSGADAVLAGKVPGSTKVLPSGPASTAMCNALPLANWFHAMNHWVHPLSQVPARGLPVIVTGSPGTSML